MLGESESELLLLGEAGSVFSLDGPGSSVTNAMVAELVARGL